MKKFTAIMMALVMVLGLTQCRPDKGNEGGTQNGSKVKVSCVVPMNKGTRSEFDNLMTDGKIKWSAGTERIYLAIPDETTPQIVEMTAFTTVESNILSFEGEVEEGLLKNGEYDIWYLGNSKNLDIPYITEEIENEVIKSISGSIASQSGDLEDLGYCHIAKTTVTATTENGEVKLNLNGILKNQIAIAHLDLEGITQLKGDAIVGTEYTIEYNNGAFEFVVKQNAKATITITEGEAASYVVLLPNTTANVDLKSNTSKKVTFEGGVEASKIYYKFISNMEYKPLVWVDYKEEINGHAYVDLGLPSGLLWATCNVGAETPEEYGNYYAWGEINVKSTYKDSNCSTNGVQMTDVSGNYEYDAATDNWGSSWRIPSKDELSELKNMCIWTWTTRNGVNGYNVEGPNGNIIFLPAAGSRYWSSLDNAGKNGVYLSSTPYENGNYNAYILSFDGSSYGLYNSGRLSGRSVRPVSGGNFEGPTAQYAWVETNDVTEITSNSAICSGNVTADNGSAVTARGICWSTSQNPTISDNKTTDGSGVGSFTSTLSNLAPQTTYYVRAYVTNAAGTSYGKQKTFTTKASNIINGHEYVDLGLSVKWATCNVGAETPERYGNYYAWGEVETKSEYTQANSLRYRKKISDFSGNPTYDVASFNWGGDWRMPTRNEILELKNNCTWIFTTQNGVKGCKVEGPNGNSIFIPAAGYYDESSLKAANIGGYYWSSTPENNDSYYITANCFYLEVEDSYHSVTANYRNRGFAIRPVIK